MFEIDLLKGQGIPARSRPEGVIATAATIFIPAVIMIIMVAVYLSNRVVINIQKREIAGYEKKLSQLSDSMKIHKAYQQRKGLIQQRISEAAVATGEHEQWSDILVTIVKNMPDSLVLKRLALEHQMTKMKIPSKKDPKKQVTEMVPIRSINMTLGGAVGDVSDREVKAFRDKLRVSDVLGPKLDDIPVSQKVELINDREVITYEMKCVLKPQI